MLRKKYIKFCKSFVWRFYKCHRLFILIFKFSQRFAEFHTMMLFIVVICMTSIISNVFILSALVYAHQLAHSHSVLLVIHIYDFFLHITNKDEQSQMLISKASSKWQNRQTAFDDALTRSLHTNTSNHTHTFLYQSNQFYYYCAIPHHFEFVFIFLCRHCGRFQCLHFENKRKTNEMKREKNVHTFNSKRDRSISYMCACLFLIKHLDFRWQFTRHTNAL